MYSFPRGKSSTSSAPSAHPFAAAPDTTRRAGTPPSVLAAARSARALALPLHGGSRYRLDVLADPASLDARLRTPGGETPAAMVVELHPNAPGPVGPLVRTLTRRFPGVPLVVACTERTPDGREVLGAAHAGAELFSFPPDDDLAALVARLVGDGGGPPEAASVAASLPRTAQRILAILMSKEPPPPETIEELADRLPMSVRTLQRRMTRHAWPAPGALLMWGRLLRGASAAEEARNGKRPFSTTELAHASGFQTVHGAAAMYRGYAEVTLQAVLSAGVSALEDALLDAFPLPGARD